MFSQKIAAYLLALSLIATPALAEEFGPPANIPNLNQSPNGEFGPPANIPTGPSEQQMEAQKRGEEMQKQGEAKQLEGTKKGAAGMERALKKFEDTYAGMEKKGYVIGPSTKEKLESVRSGLDTIKNAGSVTEIENVNLDELQNKLSTLGDDIGKYQQMNGLKKMLASMERGLVSFENRLGALEKQGVTAPADIKESLDKLKSGLATIKNAKNPDELEGVNPDELGDLMTKVNEARPRLEMVAKWPRILRQADQQLKQFKNQLTKTKAQVDRLNSQGVDVSATYDAFQSDVAKLQAARDSANDLMAAGQSEEAFNKMEDEFFNQLDNVGEHQRVIQMMSNLSRFNVEFKRGMTSAQKQIAKLQKIKLDVAEIKAIYDSALAKGNEIVALIKTTPLNEEAILSAMDEMENLKQQFQDKAEALAGGQTMPWEAKSPAQFHVLTVPKDFSETIKKITPAK